MGVANFAIAKAETRQLQGRNPTVMEGAAFKNTLHNCRVSAT